MSQEHALHRLTKFAANLQRADMTYWALQDAYSDGVRTLNESVKLFAEDVERLLSALARSEEKAGSASTKKLTKKLDPKRSLE